MRTILVLFVFMTMICTPSSLATAVVNLNNYGSSANPIYFVDGKLLPVEGAYVQLLVHVGDCNDFVSKVSDGRSIMTLTEPGYFDGGVGIVPCVPDYATVEFTLRAWTGATEYYAAQRWGSVTWRQQVGAWTSPTKAPDSPDLMNPPIVWAIPEPSTLILGLLGGAVIMFYRRR